MNRTILRVSLVLILVLSLFSVMASPAVASSPGDLDTTFGTGGKVTTSFGSYTAISESVAIQSDGKLVVVGISMLDASTGDFALARYNTDGSLDTTFGTGGKVTTSFGSIGRDQAWSVAIYKTGPHAGKIVVVGDTTASGRNFFALARYNTNGSLDTSFGGGTGKVTTDFGTTGDISPMAQAFSVALQGDDKIVLAGAFFKFFSTGWDFALARYNADGSLDTFFGGTGKVITNIGGFLYGSGDAANSVAIQSDGKIVAAGYGNPIAQGDSDFALARYNVDGSLDTTFGTGGKVTTNFGSTTDYGYEVAIQSDGKIVVAGQYGDYPSADFALARYNTDGSLDASFDTDGKVTTNFGGWDIGQSVAIQSDGKIVAAGQTQSSSPLDFAVARYNINGSLDSTFGTGGKVTTDFGGGPDVGYKVAIQSDGKIVVAGSGGATRTDFAVARYGGTVPPSNSPPVAVAGPDQMVDESATVQLDASASSDPDNNTLTFNWTVVSFTGPAITLSSFTVDKPTFSALDDGSYILKVTVNDGNGGSASDEVQVTVKNVAPKITAAVDTASIDENGSVKVSGNITDPGTLDTHTVVIAWGTGEGSTILDLAAGVLIYTASHQYLDDNPTITVLDLYPIAVSVKDDDGGTGSADTNVTVKNVAPTVNAGADQNLPFGSLVNISSAFTDPGTKDTWTYSIDWGDGSPAATGSATVGLPITGSHQYMVAGNQTITVYVMDDDLGKGSDSLTVTFVSGSGKITGGVLRFGNNGRGGFNIQSNDGVTVKGELEYQNGSVNLHAHTMTAVVVSPDLKKGWFAGVLEDGLKFVVYAEDNGEPGKNDIFKMWVDGTILNGDGKLTGGNVQIHK